MSSSNLKEEERLSLLLQVLNDLSHSMLSESLTYTLKNTYHRIKTCFKQINYILSCQLCFTEIHFFV